MNTEYISEYLNINPSKMNEWILYKTATEKYNDMNIASQNLNENEYEYNENEYEYNENEYEEYEEYKKGKNEIYVHNINMGNYNDEIYGSINIKRALKDTQDVYNMPLQIEYGLFKDPLKTMNIMYLIENDMLVSNINNAIKLENTWYGDDIQNHLLHICYHHVENIDKQEFICHPDNFTNHNHNNQITNNSYLYYTQTNSLVISIPKHTEVQHTYVNPLILKTIFLPTYHIPLQYINQHLHTYNTSKIWHNTYLYGNFDQIIEFKNSQYQQLDYQYPGILFAKFDKTHQLVVRIDNGADVSIMPYKIHKHSKFLHHLPLEDHMSTINTGNGSIKTYKFIHIQLEIQNIGIQLRLLVCNSAAYTDILLGHDAMLALGMWQDYP